MESKDILETLKKLRSKYSRQTIKEDWFKDLDDDKKQEVLKDRDAKYEALDFAINLVKSYRTLEVAKEQIQETLDTLKITNNEVE